MTPEAEAPRSTSFAPLCRGTRLARVVVCADGSRAAAQGVFQVGWSIVLCKEIGERLVREFLKASCCRARKGPARPTWRGRMSPAFQSTVRQAAEARGASFTRLSSAVQPVGSPSLPLCPSCCLKSAAAFRPDPGCASCPLPASKPSVRPSLTARSCARHP